MSRSPIRSQQWHTATKRHILNGWNTLDYNNNTNNNNLNSDNDNENNKNSYNIDGRNVEHIRLLQSTLEMKFQQLVEQLKSGAQAAKIQQEDTLSAGIVKLTKATREMTIKEFNMKHSCDLLSLLKSKDGVQVVTMTTTTTATAAPAPTEEVATNRKRDHDMVDATPAPRSRPGTIPMSISRTIRKGEGLYSANGSPVDTYEAGTMIATVTKRRRGNEGANFEINVGDGRVINLNDPTGVHALDSDMKATAASQLKVLQDQMASLMAQLTK